MHAYPKVKIKKILTIPQMKTLYFLLVYSHINNALTVWGGLTKNYLSNLEVTQKWLLKVMYRKKYRSQTLYKET